MTGRLARAALALALTVLLAGATGAGAAAAPGDLTFGGCISGDMDVTEEFGGQGCGAVPNPSAEGLFSAFDLVQQVAASPDGRDVYAVSSNEDAIVALRRDAGGVLRFVNCVTGDTAVAPCAQAPKATAGGPGSGLDAVQDVVVSPDGRHLYAAVPSDSAVAILGRDSTTGEIGFGSCVTATPIPGPAAAVPVRPLPSPGPPATTAASRARAIWRSPRTGATSTPQECTTPRSSSSTATPATARSPSTAAPPGRAER